MVREKKINTKIDFSKSPKDCSLLNSSFIDLSLKKRTKEQKIARLIKAIILNILKYTSLMDSMLFLAFNNPE
tara:strand:+ start:287 stop:502 length:216 start_codon:yes stop_codon:yes gene_type:complete